MIPSTQFVSSVCKKFRIVDDDLDHLKTTFVLDDEILYEFNCE